MDQAHVTFWASVIVVGTGLLWGLYWIPVRELDALGLPGAWGTLAITFAAALVLAPLVAWRKRGVWRSDKGTLAAIGLGGAAFALYSIGFVYGHVTIIILLWYLTPVWSTLIAKYVMGWDTPVLRLVAIVLGLVGLILMLSAGGEVPLPQGVGEWMALAAGALWAVATTTIRVRPPVAPMEAAFVFALGALAISAVLTPVLSTAPVGAEWGRAALWALVSGALFWGPAMALLMWATTKLDPARVGILLMSEVLVGAVSATLIAGEMLRVPEILGGALVLGAAVLEVWPVKPRAA